MASTQGARQGNLGLLTGALFALLWVGGGFVQDFKADSSIAYPRPTDAASAVQKWFSANGSAAAANSALQIVGGIALAVFAAVLVTLIRSTGKQGPAAYLAGLGGTLSAAMLLVSAGAQSGLGSDATAEPAVAQALYQVTFWTGGPLHVAALGLMVVGAAAGLAGVLPKWLKIAGFVAGGLALLAALSGFGQAFVAFTLFGRYLSFVWILIVSIMVAVKRAPARAGNATSAVNA